MGKEKINKKSIGLKPEVFFKPQIWKNRPKGRGIKPNLSNKINKKINFVELIQKHPESVEVLMESGMHCIGCHAAMYESLEEGAIAHGLNPDKLVKKINERLIKSGRDNIRVWKKSNSK